MKLKVYFDQYYNGYKMHDAIKVEDNENPGFMLLDVLFNMGFGLTSSNRYTGRLNEAVAWIPPSQITYIEILEKENEEEKHETTAVPEGRV